MYNKKKNKKFKRIFALVGVVVILVTAFAFPASASTVVNSYQITDIPFYNYFNCGAFSPTADIGSRQDIAQITEVDVHRGFIGMHVNYNGVSSPYVPTSYTNVTLRDACPEMVVGETYVLSMDFVNIANVTGEYAVGMFPAIVLVKEGEENIRWNVGEPLTIGLGVLDYKIMLYACSGDGTGRSCSFDFDLQLWINKDEAKRFCSYEFATSLYEDAYNKGYLDAANDINGFDVIRQDNTRLRLLAKDKDFGGVPTPFVTYDESNPLPFEFKGYNLNTRDIPSSIKEQMYKGKYPLVYEYTVDLSEEYIPAGSIVYYEAQNCQLTITLKWTVPVYNFDTGTTYIKTEQKDYVQETELFSNGTFSFPDESSVAGLNITQMIVKFWGQDLSGDWKPIHDGSVSFLSPDNPSFISGIEEGYDFGYADGLKDGEKTGYEKGYGHGSSDGFSNGHEEGYYAGRADEQEESTFFTLIYSVLDAPVKVLGNVLNFEIMGVNMMGLASSLVTFAILVTVVKYFV